VKTPLALNRATERRPAHLAPGEYTQGWGDDALARSSRRGRAVVRHANPGCVHPGLNGRFGKPRTAVGSGGM
jgi:hypothetical protein